MPDFIGTEGNDTLTGTAGRDVIAGLAGNDTINDGGGAVGDELVGGAGNDTYIVANANHTIVETADGGTDDWVRTTSLFFVLPTNVERLFYLGSADFSGMGNEGANNLVGGLGRDTLVGLDGDDLILGAPFDQFESIGGANTLIGGRGNDSYRVVVQGDSIIELADEGEDGVEVYLSSYVLPANVESLTFRDNSFAPVNFSGSGNELDNTIRGGFGRDSLAGREGNDEIGGGSGAANELVGGPGNDFYISDAIGDSIIEYANEGIDTVSAQFDFTLPDNVENLNGGFNRPTWLAVGNNLDNSIRGHLGRDTMIGGGGNDVFETSLADTTADEMFGGTGNDRFMVYAPGTSVFEYAGEGIDEIVTNLAHFTLPANVERLVFDRAGAGSNALASVGVGNELDNAIYGNDGNNTISGGGGNDRIAGLGGYDQLIGGSGADTFYMSRPSDGPDRIFDFESGIDKIAIDPVAFSTVSTLFVVQGSGFTAPDTFNSTMIYDTASGTLHLDRDGMGASAPVLVAILNAGLTLTPNDFVLASPFF